MNYSIKNIILIDSLLVAIVPMICPTRLDPGLSAGAFQSDQANYIKQGN